MPKNCSPESLFKSCKLQACPVCRWIRKIAGSGAETEVAETTCTAEIPGLFEPETKWITRLGRPRIPEGDEEKKEDLWIYEKGGGYPKHVTRWFHLFSQPVGFSDARKHIQTHHQNVPMKDKGPRHPAIPRYCRDSRVLHPHDLSTNLNFHGLQSQTCYVQKGNLTKVCWGQLSSIAVALSSWQLHV